MQYIDSFGWSLNIILMICFVIALLVLMRKPKENRKKRKEENVK
jgi:preprotein translocase subunit SecG